MKPSYASFEAVGLRAPRRRPSATARCCVLAVAALIGTTAPATAGAADLDQLTNLADQMQEAAWSQAAGTAAAANAAQAPTVDAGETVARVTHATLRSIDSTAATTTARETAGVVAAVAPAATVADAAETDVLEAAPRATVQHRPRARVHRKARPRDAAAAASPSRIAQPTEHVEDRALAEPRTPTREHGAVKHARAPGSARGSHLPQLPFRLPSLPLPLAIPSSVGAGSGDGPPVPPLVVALTAAIGLLFLEVLVRRVPSCRPTRPRRIVLPPWRPG
jgi:hypothetical protein